MSEPERRVRVLRLVEYIGPQSHVEKQVAASIHGTKSYDAARGVSGMGRVLITAATIHEFPQALEGREADLLETIDRLEKQVGNLETLLKNAQTEIDRLTNEYNMAYGHLNPKP